jgi:mono/diheme cytochrome c family protein
LLLAVLDLVASAATAGAQQSAHRGDPQEGRRFALHTCDACHVVASNDQMPPLTPRYAPSFYDIANKPGTNAPSLEAFLLHSHPLGNMPYPELTAAQAADLASYILSLHGRH